MLMLSFKLLNLFMNCMNCCCIDVMFVCIRSIDVVSSDVAFEVLDVFEPLVEVLPPIVVDDFDATDEPVLLSFVFDFGPVAMVDAPSDNCFEFTDFAEVLRTKGPGTRKVGTESSSPCWYCAGGSSLLSHICRVHHHLYLRGKFEMVVILQCTQC